LVRSWIQKSRKVIIIFSQATLLIFSYYGSFLLRFDFSLKDSYPELILQTLPIVLAVKLITFYFFRLYRGWWRYVGMSDLLDIIKAAVVSSTALYGAIWLMRGSMIGYPRSIFIIDLMLTISLIGGLRFAVRAYTEAARTQLAGSNTLIIGAGGAGIVDRGDAAREARGIGVDAVMAHPGIDVNVDVDEARGDEVIGGVQNLPCRLTRDGAVHPNDPPLFDRQILLLVEPGSRVQERAAGNNHKGKTDHQDLHC
jgi:hypothetical protein